jgi:hypothetical protein
VVAVVVLVRQVGSEGQAAAAAPMPRLRASVPVLPAKATPVGRVPQHLSAMLTLVVAVVVLVRQVKV